MTSASLAYKAIFFDMGGVVVGSPFQGISEYEKENGLPPNYINVAITRAGHQGAFQRLERGEVDIFDFYEDFTKELSDPINVSAYEQYCARRGKVFDKSLKTLKIDGRALFHQMMRESLRVVPAMLYAVQQLKASGKYKVAALTNNFLYPTDERGLAEEAALLASVQAKYPSDIFLGLDELKQQFHHYIESAKLGLRKPDPAIFYKACEIAGVQPQEVVFLDDIGQNLKAAKQCGLTTIRVELGQAEKAVAELERVLGGTVKLTKQHKL
ncbi:hypothetical protein DFQ27_005878 [Actinomortierella ambigua]|uniref:Epoxide hydrolase n=1 Tax=Actinomortierella ambigua TaxID=1343610 RepID=A0A9P6PZF0_9FUNG|nr:hypothetical protein DFQ27_005878 [Actinomortierella ambigua]